MAEPQELIRPPVENLCDPSAMEQGRHSFDPKAEEFHGVEEILSRPILVGYAFGPKVSSFTEIASTVSFLEERDSLSRSRFYYFLGVHCWSTDQKKN